MRVIEVMPADAGWMLRSDAIENALFFRSGASAESAAVRLAQGLAQAGESARVSIFIRDGSLARQFVVPFLGRLRPIAAPPLASLGTPSDRGPVGPGAERIASAV